MYENLTAEIYPNVLLAAIANGSGNAARVAALARHYAKTLPKVAEYVYETPFVAWIVEQGGIQARTAQNWVNDAVLKKNLRRDELNGRLYFDAPDKLASKYQPKTFGYSALVDPRMLADPDLWKVVVWQGYLATNEGKVMSRQIHEFLTGIPERTQREWERIAGSKKIRNICRLGNGDEGFARGKGDALGHVYYSINGRIYQRLPDIRIANSGFARTCKVGNTRTYRKKYYRASPSQFVGRGQAERERMFFLTPEAVKSHERNERKDGAVSRHDRYLWKRHNGYNHWELIEAAADDGSGSIG